MEPEIVIIVPYKNRKSHYNFYIKYMNNYMNNIYKKNFKIFFCNQLEDKPFNRGAIKNIGFLICKKLYKNYKNITFMFQDIDTLPIHNLDLKTNRGIIKDFYGVDKALHSLFTINGADFEKLKGYPNFWYWGFEDNVLYDKAINNNLKIDRSIYYELGDTKNIIILDNNDKSKRLFSNKQGWDYLNKNYDNFDDLKNIKYTIFNNFFNIESYETHTNYKDCDIEYIFPSKIIKIKPLHSLNIKKNINNNYKFVLHP